MMRSSDFRIGDLIRNPFVMSVMRIFVLGLAGPALAGHSLIDSTSGFVPVGYGVPSFPAFELLPDKPSEVTHLGTPSDFSIALSQAYIDGKLQPGAAFQFRPFINAVGSLDDYQKSLSRQAFWRTEASFGTANIAGSSGSVFLSGGLRIPIIDRSDPRADKEYSSKIRAAYADALQNHPKLDSDSNELADRSSKAYETTRTLREAFVRKNWNKLKLDIGAAVQGRSKSGGLFGDSLEWDRSGLWLAFGRSMGRKFELNGGVKYIWSHPDSNDGETNRLSGGFLAKYGLAKDVAALVEFAGVGSFREHGNVDDDWWLQYSASLEFNIRQAGGWFAFTLGDEAGRDRRAGPKFSFQYRIAPNAFLDKD